MNFLRAVCIIAGKDLRVEFRQRENFTLMLFFSLVILVIFHFTLDFTELSFETVGAGVIWIAIHFTGILTLGHSFRQEQAQDSLRGLRLTPIDPAAIYLGKWLANTATLFAMEVVLIPLIAVTLNFPLARFAGPLFLLIALHTIGFSALGTLFAAIAAQTRRGETLFPLLVFPVEIPLIGSAVRSTTTILNRGTLADVVPWLELATAFNLLVLGAGVLLFEYILEES
ncbi:MAG: heme exporter protein CcmB [Acidobacteria bacterium]|nr:heme exporter protein CcmB [Acidobacteriota bacterium]